MSLRPWYNKKANYQTNAKSFMDYLARTNHFLEVLIEDYEIFQELVIEELERIKFDSEMAVDDILYQWLEDGTLARIINDGVLGNKADTEWVNTQLNDLKESIENDVNVQLENMENYVNDQIDNIEPVHPNDWLKPLSDIESELLTKDESYIDIKNNPYFNAVGDGTKYTIRERFPEVTLNDVKVLNHEATLDSSADWFAIQFAMEKALEQGKTVYLSAGDYQIDETLYYKAYQRMKGAGHESVLRSRIQNGFVIEHHPIEGQGSRYIHFSDFQVNGSAHLGSGGGIEIRYGAHAGVLDNLWVKYFSKENQMSVRCVQTWHLFIQNCDISNSYIGIRLGSTTAVDVTNNVVIRDCRINGFNGLNGNSGRTGISSINGNSTVISSCQIENWEVGVYLQCFSSVVENCYFEINKVHGIDIQGDGNRVINNYFYTHPITDLVEVIISENCKGNVIENLYGRNFRTNEKFVYLSNTSRNNIVTNIRVEDSSITNLETVTGMIEHNSVTLYDDTRDNGKTEMSTPVFDDGIAFSNKSPRHFKQQTLYVANGELRFYDGSNYFKVELTPVV